MLAVPLFAQQRTISFNHYTHADGLSNNWVFSILQDNRGFLWIGTWDGLNQFDGKDFRIYLHDDADPNTPAGKEIKSLMQDAKGLIWIGTEKGLCNLDPLSEVFTMTPFEARINENIGFESIHSVVQDKNGGRIWAGGNGLFFVGPSGKSVIAATGGLNDSLFFGTNHSINHILPDGSRLWLATSHGLLIYYPAEVRWEKVPYTGKQEFLPGLDFITNLYIDTDGNLWATSWGAGLLKVDTAQRTILEYHLSEPENTSASHNILNGIAQTDLSGESNTLWISAVTGGLLKFDRKTKQFESFGTNDPDETGRVYKEGYSVCFLPGIGLWVATRIGLYQYDPLQQSFMELLPFPENEEQEMYFSLVYADPLDPTGNTLLLCTNNQGLYEFKTAERQIHQINNRFGQHLEPDIYISDIHRDQQGELWMATLLKGLIGYRKNEAIRYVLLRDARGDTIKWINEIMEIPGMKDQLWIATDRGLYQYNKKSGKYRQIFISEKENEISDASVFALTSIHESALWFIGFDKAQNAEFIARLNPEAFSAKVVLGPYSKTDPRSIRLTDLAPGTDGIVIVSSYHGLYSFQSSASPPSLSRFIQYGQSIRSRVDQLKTDQNGNVWALSSDDLYKLDFVTNQLYRIAYENLWKNSRLNINLNEMTGDIMLGSWRKIFIIQNDSNLISSKPYRKYITGIRTGNGFYRKGSHDLTNSRIVLPFRDNSVTVEYTAINFRTGSYNEYAYRMSGLNEEWAYTGNESVSYRLPQGKYQFQLRSVNANGQWDDSYVYTDIVIRPPFYLTWWFAGIVVVLLIIMVYTIYRYRINQFLKLQKMRDNISRDLHDDIGSSLTNIAIMNELAVQETRSGGDTEKILLKSAEDIHEIISSLSDIVWNVNPEYDDLKFLLARMRRYALDLLDNTGMALSMDIVEPEDKIRMNMEQRRDLYLIFKEGLNNLVKYSKASKAEIRIRIEHNSVLLSIGDDGEGFEPGRVEFGNGLKNMRQRTEAWNGTFRIDSALRKGTKLHFTIPVKN